MIVAFLGESHSVHVAVPDGILGTDGAIVDFDVDFIRAQLAEIHVDRHFETVSDVQNRDVAVRGRQCDSYITPQCPQSLVLFNEFLCLLSIVGRKPSVFARSRLVEVGFVFRHHAASGEFAKCCLRITSYNVCYTKLLRLDGWWDEGYSPDCGWAIGHGEDYENAEYQDAVESQALYNLLENEVAPSFYDRQEGDLSSVWLVV